MLPRALLLAWSLQVHGLDQLVGERLQQLGLTRRESESVQHRHRRRMKVPILLPELEDTIAALPPGLLDGQVTELLRSMPAAELRTHCAAHAAGGWCTFKRRLCVCGSLERRTGVELQQAAPPSMVAFDCEFKPLRMAAVDDHRRIVMDYVVVPDEPPAGTSTSPLPSVLRCDRPSLVPMAKGELRRRLREWAAAGTVLVGHTPLSDLRAIGIEVDEAEELLRSGRLVDVGRLGLTEQGEQVASLKRMSQHEGVAPLGFQAGGARHCAIEDALVTLDVYDALRRRLTADGDDGSS